MTNKEYIIEAIKKQCPYAGIDDVKEIFEIINHRDWIHFTSQMGDYDHPGERKEADENMKKKLEEYQLLHQLTKDVIPAVEYWMEYDNFIIGPFYHEYFHKLDEKCTLRCCLNCESYNEEYPDPKCIRCITGWNNDYHKPDYFKMKEE